MGKRCFSCGWVFFHLRRTVLFRDRSCYIEMQLPLLGAQKLRCEGSSCHWYLPNLSHIYNSSRWREILRGFRHWLVSPRKCPQASVPCKRLETPTMTATACQCVWLARLVPAFWCQIWNDFFSITVENEAWSIYCHDYFTLCRTR